VAVTPASGFVLPTGGFVIGLIAGVVCYVAVMLKPKFGYDDSLDAFGVHGVGGFLGAVLTGVFCYSLTFVDVDLTFGGEPGAAQVIKQLKAAALSAGLAFGVSFVLIKVLDLLMGFVTDERSEITGLDQTEHGEAGFDYGPAMESASLGSFEPRAATVPPGGKRFSIVVDGVNNGDLLHAWSDMCQPGKADPAMFKEVYNNVTTVTGNRFNFRGGDPESMKQKLQVLLQGKVPGKVNVSVH
jgi:hypothetical protein